MTASWNWTDVSDDPNHPAAKREARRALADIATLRGG